MSPIREIILVVDDDATIANLCKTILAMGGYEVVTTGSADVAQRLVQEGGNVQLALLDVMMPGINGIELARRLRRLKPGIKVVLMSGYHPAEVSQLAGEDSTLQVIWKPFHAESLLRMIENVLKTPALQSADAAGQSG